VGQAFFTLKRFIEVSRVQWFRGDPLLMGAAIAYNSLFALVPLAVAFVSLINLLGLSVTIATRLTNLINATLPPDIAAFLIDLFESSSSVVGADDTLVLILSILIALWSGSRAVYAVQKALRLIQAIPDERGYLRTRAVGILVTVGAGVSVMIGYSVLVFGETLWNEAAPALGFGSTSLAQSFLAVLIAVWVYGILWVVYQFGPPRPVEHSAVVALAVEIVLAGGAWFSLNLLPSDARSAAAAFGVLGVILILLYFVGVAIVGAPIIVTSAWEAWSDAQSRYASEDDAGTVEPEGSTQGSEPPREAAQ
jgi:membrane protein